MAIDFHPVARRVCQRARKKLAHMLPQEEFEKVVVTWQLGEEKGEGEGLGWLISWSQLNVRCDQYHIYSKPIMICDPIIYLVM